VPEDDRIRQLKGLVTQAKLLQTRATELAADLAIQIERSKRILQRPRAPGRERRRRLRN